MSEFLNITKGLAAQLTPMEWAITAGVLFMTVIWMGALRLLWAKMKRPKPQAAPGPQLRAVDGGGDASYLSAKPVAAPRPARPRPAPRVVHAADANAVSRAAAARAEPSDLNIADALSKVDFAAKPMMPWEQYCLLRDIEAFLFDQNAGHRLFSKVQLSDAFGVSAAQMTAELSEAVDRALKPFKLDFLILDRHGMPVLALHMAPANPVLETICDNADLPLLILPQDYSWMTVESQLSLHLGAPLQPLREAS